MSRSNAERQSAYRKRQRVFYRIGKLVVQIYLELNKLGKR